MNERKVVLKLHIDRSRIDGTARANEPQMEFNMEGNGPACDKSKGNDSDCNTL